MEKHKIDDLFANKLAAYEAPVSEDAWNQISDQLNKNKRFGLAAWLSIAASAALLIASAMLIFEDTDNHLEGVYITDQLQHGLEPNVPKMEGQIPLFIGISSIPVERENENTIIEQVDKKNVQNSVTTAPENTVVIVEQTDLPATDISPLLDSEFSKVTPVFVSSEQEPPSFSELDSPEEQVLIASNEILSQPVQIIYKQGQVEEQSKISKALTFMDDVRKGEKRLINLNKFKDSLFTKNKEEGTNSK